MSGDEDDGSDEDDDWFTRALREGEGDDGDEAEFGGGPARDEPDAAGGPAPGDWPAGDASGAGSDDGDDGPFAEDFATAFQNAPDFDGMGESGGFGPAEGDAPTPGSSVDFDDESFESDLARIDIGIKGLDGMILGGVPAKSLMAVVGSAGTGKTTFGLQFLHRGLQQDERAVYISLEERRDRIVETADEKGFDFTEYADSGRLAVVDLDPIEMANSLASIRSELPELVEEFGATRLVLDSVSLLEMMYDRPSRRRSEVFEFTRSLKRAGITTLVTSEASQDSAYASRYGIIEYLADAVFVLQYVRPSDFRETRLAVEIQKIRNANHSRETKPYEITEEGINVYQQANIF